MLQIHIKLPQSLVLSLGILALGNCTLGVRIFVLTIEFKGYVVVYPFNLKVGFPPSNPR